MGNKTDPSPPILVGRISCEEHRNSTQWFGQAQGSLDPLKEAKAAVLRIDNNLSTSARESMEINGSDIEDNIEQRGREVKKMKKYELMNNGKSKKDKTKGGGKNELT